MDGTLFDVKKLADGNRVQNGAEIRRRVHVVPLPDGTSLCRMLGKYKFFVDSVDVGFGAQIMMEGFWEMGLTEFMVRNVKEGANIVDVGANYGYYTILLADLIGSAGKIYAIEPNPRALATLKKSASVNGINARVTFDSRAAWDTAGEKLTFRVPDHEPKNARVVQAQTAVQRTDITEFEVESMVLDDLPLREIDLLKIDVEGAEERVWRGMKSFLAHNPDMVTVLEFNCGRCRNARATLEEIHSMFPLRHMARGSSSEVLDVTPEQILEKPKIDWILILAKRQVQ